MNSHYINFTITSPFFKDEPDYLLFVKERALLGLSNKMINQVNFTKIQIPLNWDHECFNGIFKFAYQLFGYESYVFAEVQSVNLTGHVYSDYYGEAFPIRNPLYTPNNNRLGKRILFIIISYIALFVIFYHNIITTQKCLLQIFSK